MSDTPRRWYHRLAFLVAPFRWAWRTFYYLPRLAQAALVLVVAAGLVGGGVYVFKHKAKRAKEREVASAWRDFEDAARKSDADAMRTALDRVLKSDPAEPLAVKRKTTLDTGAAADDDAEMAIVMVNLHQHARRLPDAAREAEKVLRKYAKHWRARCILVEHAALVLKDKDKAAAELALLPDPEDREAFVDPGALLHAIHLSDALGRDAANLRGLIVRRMLPALRGGAAAKAPAAAKAQLVSCYLQPFGDDAALNDLAGYWAAASKLADAAVTEAVEKGDADVLVQLGLLGDRSLRALARLRDHEKMADDQFQALAKEINDRTRQAWAAAREKVPARPEPYRGLAVLAVRANDKPAAVGLLRDGIAACGDRPELLELLTPLLADAGDAAVAMKLTWAAAEKAGNDPAKWCLAANAAAAAHRRDVAIAACQNALRPPNEKHPLALQMEARFQLDAGEPSRALERLRAFPPDALRTNPLLALLHARAITQAGLTVLLDDEFKAVGAAHDAGGALRPPVAPVLFLRGVLDGKNADRVGWVATRANEVAARWPDDANAKRLVAEALFRKAELTDPPWGADASREAVRAFDALPPAAKDDPGAVAMLAALQHRGLNNPAAANRTLAPLRDPAAAPFLTPWQLEVLGGATVAAGRPQEAVALLERAVRTPGAPAGCRVQLALAYHAHRQTDRARDELDRALSLPRTPREQAEWRAAKLLIHRGEP